MREFLITIIVVLSVLTWGAAIWQLVQRTAYLFEKSLTGHGLMNLGILCCLFAMPIAILALMIK